MGRRWGLGPIELDGPRLARPDFVVLCCPVREPGFVLQRLNRPSKRILRNKTVAIFPVVLSAADVTCAMLTC